MDFVPHEFTNVPYGSIVAAECAPRVVDPRFKGIAIRAPETVRKSAAEATVLPVCGYYQLETGSLVNGAIMLVHVRSLEPANMAPQTGQVVPLEEDIDEPLAPPPGEGTPVDPRLYAGQLTESYFYLDIQRYLKQRLGPGSYEVCVSFGQARSNVVRVTVTFN